MNKYPEYIMKVLRERKGLDEDDKSRDEEFNLLSPNEAFEEIIRWEGYGSPSSIITWIEDTFKVEFTSDKIITADEKTIRFWLPGDEWRIARDIISEAFQSSADCIRDCSGYYEQAEQGGVAYNYLKLLEAWPEEYNTGTVELKRAELDEVANLIEYEWENVRDEVGGSDQDPHIYMQYKGLYLNLMSLVGKFSNEENERYFGLARDAGIDIGDWHIILTEEDLINMNSSDEFFAIKLEENAKAQQPRPIPPHFCINEAIFDKETDYSPDTELPTYWHDAHCGICGRKFQVEVTHREVDPCEGCNKAIAGCDECEHNEPAEPEEEFEPDNNMIQAYYELRVYPYAQLKESDHEFLDKMNKYFERMAKEEKSSK